LQVTRIKFEVLKIAAVLADTLQFPIKISLDLQIPVTTVIVVILA